jgi:hypothetical protein
MCSTTRRIIGFLSAKAKDCPNCPKPDNFPTLFIPYLIIFPEQALDKTTCDKQQY